MQSTQEYSDLHPATTPIGQIHRALNTRWHKQALLIFLVIVLAHWVEHILQAIQIFVLGWPRPTALGGLGLFFPWLVSSETLHYAYAILMLLGLYLLRPAFDGRARVWWNIALAIQFWHHFEHGLLLVQAIIGRNLFGLPAPTSILQLVFPRVELHLFYNVVVFIPMIIAMYYHRYSSAGRAGNPICNCERPRRQQTAMS